MGSGDRCSPTHHLSGLKDLKERLKKKKKPNWSPSLFRYLQTRPPSFRGEEVCGTNERKRRILVVNYIKKVD